MESTAALVRGQWAEKLDRIQIKGASDKDLEIFYTAVVHGLTYPSEQHEENHYYSAYDNKVHEGSESYTGYSIWVSTNSMCCHDDHVLMGILSPQDTYRAAWAWTILFAPERLPGMVTSMLNDFKEVYTKLHFLLYLYVLYKGGWLPMWKNIVETNIMVSP